MSIALERLQELMPTFDQHERLVNILKSSTNADELKQQIAAAGWGVDILQALLPITAAMYEKNVFPMETAKALTDSKFTDAMIVRYFSGEWGPQPLNLAWLIKYDMKNGDLPQTEAPTLQEAKEFNVRAMDFALSTVRHYLFETEE